MINYTYGNGNTGILLEKTMELELKEIEIPSKKKGRWYEVVNMVIETSFSCTCSLERRLKYWVVRVICYNPLLPLVACSEACMGWKIVLWFLASLPQICWLTRGKSCGTFREEKNVFSFLHTLWLLSTHQKFFLWRILFGSCRLIRIFSLTLESSFILTNKKTFTYMLPTLCKWFPGGVMSRSVREECSHCFLVVFSTSPRCELC